ncbi:MAG TPA: amino acid transport protein [bacterium]|nr:amino acid transport protein [bacterium]
MSSLPTLILGGILSLIGMGAFIYGRRTGRTGPLIGGGVLMVVPYFIQSPALLVLVGAAGITGMYLFPE